MRCSPRSSSSPLQNSLSARSPCACGGGSLLRCLQGLPGHGGGHATGLGEDMSKIVPCQFERVVLMDADMYVQQDLDPLFKMPLRAPIAVRSGLLARLGQHAAAKEPNEPPGPDEKLAISWGRFTSGDPNVRVAIESVRNKHVILLMNMAYVDEVDGKGQPGNTINAFFEQLALLLHLQRFRVPAPNQAFAKRKWKGIGSDGFELCAVRSLSVIIPWNRFGQMERVRRWEVGVGGEGKPAWVDTREDGPSAVRRAARARTGRHAKPQRGARASALAAW